MEVIMNFHSKKTQRIISAVIVAIIILTFVLTYVLSVLQ